MRDRLMKAHEEGRTIAHIQAVVPQALRPGRVHTLSAQQWDMRCMYLKTLLNPVRPPPPRARDVTTEEIAALSHCLVVGLQLYQHISSPSLHKRVPPRKAIKGAELLTRLVDVDGHIIAPAQFLQAAEETGVLADLSLATMQVGRRIAQCIADGRGAKNLYLSANVPQSLLGSKNFSQSVFAMLEDMEVSGELGLEILEKDVIPGKAVPHLNSLARHNTTNIMIDDYPEKHALDNLEILQNADVPVRAVKISGHAVKNLGDASSVRAMEGHIEMACEGGTRIVICEGCAGGIPAAALARLQEIDQRMGARYEGLQVWFQGNPMPY